MYMKTSKMLLIMPGALALWPRSMYAQESVNAVSVDVFLPLMSPVSRLAGEMAWIPFNVKYQRVISSHLAVMAKSGVNYSWAAGEKILDVYPMLALEWRPFHTGLKGFYLGPSLFFNYSNYWNDYAVVTNPDHAYWIAAGGNLGWQFVLRPRIVIDVTFGLGYGYNAEVGEDGATKSHFTMDETLGGVYVGFCF